MEHAASPESPSPFLRSRRSFYGIHTATAILILAGQFFIRTEAMLYALMFPLGLALVGVIVYSIVKTVQFGPPRWKGVTLTLLLMPGSVAEFIGPVIYLILSLTLLAETRERGLTDQSTRLFPPSGE